MYSHLYIQFLMKSDQIVVKDGKLMDWFFPAADGVAESCQVIGFIHIFASPPGTVDVFWIISEFC